MKIRTREVAEGFSQNIYEFGQGSPKIMITSGVHGNEVTAIYVIENLIKYLSTQEIIKGSIKIVSNSNPFAVNDIRRKAYVDDVDMNRIFPGNINGSETFKAANSLWEESEGMETIIDVHCCSQSSMPYILSIYNEKPELIELCNKINIPVLVQSEGTGGQFFTESCRQRNQQAIIIELPSGVMNGAINFPVYEQCYDAIVNFLKGEGLIEGEAKYNPPTKYSPMVDIVVDERGIWIPHIEKGTKITKGMVLGEFNGKNIEAPVDGLALIVIPGAYLFSGDFVLSYIVEI